MNSVTIQFIFTVLLVAIFYPYSVDSQQYDVDQDNKILGLKHFEEFLRDLEKTIADWTKRIRNAIVDDGQKGQVKQRNRRQDQPSRKFTDWVLVKDVIEGVKFAQKQITDFVDRISRVITGDQLAIRDSYEVTNGPYVPVVKELREFLVHLQRRLTAWSNELERVFIKPDPNNEINLISN